jgi:uncharacterized protein (TIGR00369 family)
MKKVKDSSIRLIQLMTPQDANLSGNVHGGTIMKLIDSAAGLVAVRHTGKNAVTASIDRLDFHSPVFVGDLLRVSGSLNFVGKTSMELGVRVEAENVISGQVRHTASAYLTYVCLEHGKPAAVPPVEFETPDEIRRNREALERRRRRLIEKQQEKH